MLNHSFLLFLMTGQHAALDGIIGEAMSSKEPAADARCKEASSTPESLEHVANSEQH